MSRNPASRHQPLRPGHCLFVGQFRPVGRTQIQRIKKLCKVDDEDLASMIDDIKSLNPKPAAAYKYDLTTYVIPDVYVRRNKDASYHIELNNMSLPRLLINRQYYADILSGKTDRQAKRYLKDNLAQANFLLKALHQRATTILRVSEEIVKQQHEFLNTALTGSNR